MRVSGYMNVTGPWVKDGKVYANVKIKWWGYPIIIAKTMREHLTANLWGWLYLLLAFPVFWYRLAKQMPECDVDMTGK